MPPTPSTELALRAFEAGLAFNTALAELQAEPAAGTIYEEAQRAATHGFSWFARPSKPGFVEVRLCHKAGAEISADGESITALLAGLLGHPLAQDVAVFAAAQAAESEQEGALLPTTRSALAEADAAIDAVEAAAGALLAAPAPSPAQAAAESLAAFTGGAVVTEPDEAEQARTHCPLTAEQKTVCVGMIKALTSEQRRLFTIAFRDAFRVPREEKAIAPLITEVRHMEFCDRWSIEAGGGVAA